MNDQLKTILSKAKLNFAILAAILLIAFVGKFTNPEFTNSVFVTADQLVSDLYIVFIAITLGAFIPNFKLVAFGSIAALGVDHSIPEGSGLEDQALTFLAKSDVVLGQRPLGDVLVLDLSFEPSSV